FLVHEGLKTDRLELFEHVLHATANLLALGLERRQFGAGAFALGDPGARGVELAAHAAVLVLRARELRAGLVEHRDELFQFLFEAIDRFEFNAGHCRLRHAYLLTAPWESASAFTMRSIAASTSASVNVRSGERNVSRSERLTRPSGTPLPR